jgi:hypothetical protein
MKHVLNLTKWAGALLLAYVVAPAQTLTTLTTSSGRRRGNYRSNPGNEPDGTGERHLQRYTGHHNRHDRFRKSPPLCQPAPPPARPR